METIRVKSAPGVTKHAGRYKITEQNFSSLAALRTWALAKFKGSKNFEVYWPAKWSPEEGVWYWDTDRPAFATLPTPSDPLPQVVIGMGRPVAGEPPKPVMVLRPSGGNWFLDRFREWSDERKARRYGRK